MNEKWKNEWKMNCNEWFAQLLKVACFHDAYNETDREARCKTAQVTFSRVIAYV